MSKVLVINCGSSSVKYQLFNMADRSRLLCKGMVERISQPNSYLLHSKGKLRFKKSLFIKNHSQAISIIVEVLEDKKFGLIKDYSDIYGIGHRVVHGGEEFRKPIFLNDSVVKRLSKYDELAPLHNPPNITGIKVCRKLFPGIRQVAIFDTAFYGSVPEYAYMYAIPYRYYKKHLVRRFGFHGTSHNYVMNEAARLLKKPLSKLRLISCHLGNGCSITAIRFGKAIDTSMGFTPLEGLIMGTRCGDIDASIPFYLVRKLKSSNKDILEVLNRKSGLLGISGISNDMRDLIAKYKLNKRARLAIDMFIYRIRKYIGSYVVSLGGIDAIIFTAGIGENQPFLRRKICKGFSKIFGNKKLKVLAVPTNEELMIAYQTYGLLKGNRR